MDEFPVHTGLTASRQSGHVKAKRRLIFLQGWWLFKNKPIIFTISIPRNQNLNAWYIIYGLLRQIRQLNAQSVLDDELAAARHYSVYKLWENGSNVNMRPQSNKDDALTDKQIFNQSLLITAHLSLLDFAVIAKKKKRSFT